MPQRSRNAAPRSATARVDDPDPVAAALAVQRVRVEVADQPGAEHGDRVPVHQHLLLGPVGKGEEPRRVGHEQAVEHGTIDPGGVEQPTKTVQQPGQAGRATVDAVVAAPRGIHPEDDLVVEPVLGHPLDQLQGAVRPVAPAERSGRTRRTRRSPAARGGSRGRRPCRRGCSAMCPGATPWSASRRTCSSAPVPPSQWVRIGTPVRRCAWAAASKTRPVAVGRAAVAPGDLDDPGPVRRPADDRSAVVVRVDAVGDVGDEQVGQLVDRTRWPSAPARSTARGGARSGR